MPLPRGTSELRSTGPKLVPLLAMRCLYQGGPSDLSARRTSENLNTLGVLGLASQRSFLRRTNEKHRCFKHETYFSIDLASTLTEKSVNTGYVPFNLIRVVRFSEMQVVPEPN